MSPAHAPFRLTRRRRWLCLVVVAAMGVAGCGSGDDGGTAADGPTSTTGNSDTPASDGGDTGAEPAVDGAAESAAGGIDDDLTAMPELAGLTRAELLQDAFGVPAEMPVLDLELLYVFASASGLSSGFGTLEHGVDYTAPDGTAPEVLAAIDAEMDASVWAADGESTEPSEGYYSQRYQATGPDGASLTVTFQEEAGKVVLRSSVSVDASDPPELLWPWATDIQRPAGAEVASWGVQYPDTALGPNLALTMTFASDLGYDALAAFVSDLPTGVLEPGEVAVSTDPFTKTESAVTAQGGFSGRFSVTQTSPQSSPNLTVAGTVAVG